MPRRLLGHLPTPVSVIGFGSWAIGGMATFGGNVMGWGPQDRSEALRAIHRALDLGINFFDTADIYGLGASESLLGEALQGHSQNTVLCTKFGSREMQGKAIKDFTPAWLMRSVENSLLRLKREQIDILLLHGPPDDFDWIRFDRAPFEALKSQGKILSYGVSCHSYRGAENVLTHCFGDVIEAIYNILDRRLGEKALPAAMKANVGVIARVPLASGFLTGKYTHPSHPFDPTDVRSGLSKEDVRWRIESARKLSPLDALPGGLVCSALRFCLSHPGITTVIPGMRSVRQVEENVRAAERGPLEEMWCREAMKLVPTVCPEWN